MEKKLSFFFLDSKTVRFLEAYGVLGVLQKVWTTVVYYTDIIYGYVYFTDFFKGERDYCI